VIRTLKKRVVQLFLIGLMMLLSSFIYTVMDYSVNGALQPAQSYFDESNQEDFAIQTLDILLEDDYTFLSQSCASLQTTPQENWPYDLVGLYNIDATCFENLLNHRIQTIKSVYSNIDLETREYKDLYFSMNGESYRFRALKDMQRINKSFIFVGEKPVANNEIAVSEIFAKKNQLEIGDSIEIGDTSYNIVGYVLFPDYTLTLLGSTLIIDNKTQSLVLFNDDTFHNLSERIHVEIGGTLQNGYTEKDFQNNVISDYSNHDELQFITNIVLTVNNIRSGGVYADLEGGEGMGLFLSLLIASIALMIVSVMISRILHNQRGAIGILKSLGYRNFEIGFPYILAIAVLSLPMLLIGYYLGLQVAHPMMMAYLEFYVLPHQEIIQSLKTIFIAIVVPYVFLLVLSYIIILRLLKQKPVTLLQPQVTQSTNKFALFMSKKLGTKKITNKLRQLLLYRSPTKLVVYVIGMFYAAFLILMSLSMNGIFDRMIYDYYDNTHHQYIGYCEYGESCVLPTDKITYDAEKVIELPSVTVNGLDASIVGLDPSSKIHPIFDKHHNEITTQLENGIVITKSLSLLRGYKIGDELTIRVGNKTIKQDVVGVTEEYTGKKLYISRSFLGSSLMNNSMFYNVVYSDAPIDETNYAFVVNVDDIVKQAGSMNVLMQTMVLLLIVISVMIGGIIIYILSVMTIEDNFYNISLFKVMGFTNKEIDQMVLGGYFRFGILIFIFSIPISIGSFSIMSIFFAQYFDLIFPFHFVYWHAILTIVIYIVLFEVGAYSAKNKLNKISLQEAMKLYEI
jgi:putative ABC transport system permease protein